ncbi:MAG: NAD(P)H-dependent oxidoreductase [Verrucomicrobiales bacterium]|nr:NAD(P)H-dependent oxidoreductase [Verrucomicrobiales bacterium]
MPSPKLIALSGSARRGSLNRAVLSTAAIAASSTGAEITLVDLNDYELPVFNQDLEDAEGLPDAARKLKTLFRASDGFILASPEHNSSYSALLKNTIDWCSRTENDDEPPLSAFAGKSAVLLAASPGALGGLRGLFALRELLQNLRVTVHPEMLAVRSAHEVITDGVVTDAKWAKKIGDLVKEYVAFARKLAS